MSAECLIKSGIVASFFFFFYLVGWQKKIYLCVFIECEIYHLTLNMYYYKNIYAKSLQKHNNFLPYNLYVPWPSAISPMVRTRSHHNSIIIDGFARFMRSRPNLEKFVFELFYIAGVENIATSDHIPRCINCAIFHHFSPSPPSLMVEPGDAISYVIIHTCSEYWRRRHRTMLRTLFSTMRTLPSVAVCNIYIVYKSGASSVREHTLVRALIELRCWT